MNRFFLLLAFISSPCFSREYIFVADQSAIYENAFSRNVENFESAGSWEKIKFLLEREGHSVRAIKAKKLKSLPDSKNRQIVVINSIREKYIDHIHPKHLNIIIFEPPSVSKKIHDKKFRKRFHKIFSFESKGHRGEKLIQYFHPVMAPMNPDLAAFEKRKLITLIAKNQDSDYKHELYSERRKAAYYFSQNEKDFDLYGSNWERENLVSFKGKAFSKIDTMKNYKFYLCYENNSDLDGYITEKIFDCFQAGAIPIYLGAPNIVEEIPRNCFIDRRLFSSYEELHQFLLAITEEQFENYLDNIRKFLQSPQAKKYTLNSFAFCIASGLL